MIFEIIMKVVKDKSKLMTKCILIWFSNTKKQQLILSCSKCHLLS